MKGSPIDSFFVALGFDVDDKELTAFESKLETAKIAAFAFGAAIVGAVTGLAAFTAHVAEQADALGDFATQEQVSVEAIQEFGHAAQLNGSSVDAIKNSISGLNRVTGEAILGLGRGAKIFEKLGLEAKDSEGKVKTFDTLLEEVADKMKGMSNQESIAMAEKLGIDRSLVPMLMQGKDAIRSLREEARAFGIITEEDAAQAGALADSMDRTKFLMNAISESIAIKMMPALGNVIDRFRNWIMTNREFINGAIDKAVGFLSEALVVLFNWLSNIIELITDVIQWLGQFKVVTYTLMFALTALTGLAVISFMTSLYATVVRLVGAFMALNVQALLIPALLGAIVGALLLIVDDYQNWKEGNDSVIGDIIAKYPEAIAVIQTLESVVSFLGDVFKAIGVIINSVYQLAILGTTNVIDAIASLIQSFSGAGQVFSAVGQTIVGVFMSIYNAVLTVIGAIGNFISSISNGLNAAKNLLSLGFGGASMKLPNLTQTGTITSSGVLGSTNHNNSTSQNNVTNMGGVNIHIKSTDPVKAGQETNKAINQLHRNTSRNNKSSVVQ